ncbi:hypothetical protein LINPERHAP1_LOCUS29218 [Linum perenne]
MMVNALRRIIIAKNGRLNSPIKHLDWHPDYMCLNLFYIPMGLYNNLPASVYLLLVYMSRVNTIGMILNKTKLRLCFQSWDIFLGSMSLFDKWLVKFWSADQWRARISTEDWNEYLFISFRCHQSVHCENDEARVVETPVMVMEGSLSENPMNEPSRAPIAWRDMKQKMILCNNLPRTSVLESLTNSLNYTSDGRIKENIGIIPITRLERDYFYEAVHSRSKADILFRKIREAPRFYGES